MYNLMPRAFLVLLMLILLAFSGGCGEKQQDFAHLMDLEVAEIAEISMRCGTTGEAVRLTQTDEIEAFLALFEGITFSKAKDQSERAGFLYYADIHHAEGSTSRITFIGEYVSVGDVYFESSKEILQEQLDAVFQ